MSNPLGLQEEQTKPRPTRTKVTPEVIDQILTDKYHNGLSTSTLKSKYRISHAVLKQVDEKFGGRFKEIFGVKAKSSKDVSLDEMEAIWKAKKKQK